MSIPRTHNWFQQQRTKGLPQTSDEPQRARYLVEGPRTMGVLLVKDGDDPRMNQKEVLHLSEIVPGFDLYLPKSGHRSTVNMQLDHQLKSQGTELGNCEGDAGETETTGSKGWAKRLVEMIIQ